MLPSTNWKNNFNLEAFEEGEPGNQILHTRSTNKPYQQIPSAIEFVQAYLSKAQPLESDAAVLKFGIDAVSLTSGYYLEMGVGLCRTINFIAALQPLKTVYGFDSFQGLPEDWDQGDKVFPKGTFAPNDPANFKPSVHHNVRIFPGLFREVLPDFKDQVLKDFPIAFLHIDCDSYNSTKAVFEIVGKNIVTGTVIVFDELYNYPNYAQHEWKAFQEFLATSGYTAEFLAYNVNHEQVAVRVK